MKINPYREYLESKIGRVRDAFWYDFQKTLISLEMLSYEGIDKYVKKSCKKEKTSNEITKNLETQWLGLAPYEIKVRELLPTMQVVFNCEIQQPVRQTFYYWFSKHKLRGAYHLTYKKSELLPVVKTILNSRFVNK